MRGEDLSAVVIGSQGRVRDDLEPRERVATLTVTGQARVTGPAVDVGRQQRERHGVVERRARLTGDEVGGQELERRGVERARIGAPVQDPRQAFTPARADQDEAVVSGAEDWQQTLARERLDWLYTYDATAIPI